MIQVKSATGELVAIAPILIGSPVAGSPVPRPHSPGAWMLPPPPGTEPPGGSVVPPDAVTAAPLPNAASTSVPAAANPSNERFIVPSPFGSRSRLRCAGRVAASLRSARPSPPPGDVIAHGTPAPSRRASGVSLPEIGCRAFGGVRVGPIVRLAAEIAARLGDRPPRLFAGGERGTWPAAVTSTRTR